jgi:hypothetical protein
MRRNAPAPAPLVGASEEVIAHHAQQHACDPGADCEAVMCPCGKSAALVCTACHQPVFVALSGAVMCQHARELIGLPA